MDESRLPQPRPGCGDAVPAEVGKRGNPMNDRWIIDERELDSAVLREATEKLNFIWRLAHAYRAPLLLEWLDRLTEELAGRRDFVRANLGSRSPRAAR
jgi:hypothetical protein